MKIFGMFDYRKMEKLEKQERKQEIREECLKKPFLCWLYVDRGDLTPKQADKLYKEAMNGFSK